jgi:hypothetical protein
MLDGGYKTRNSLRYIWMLNFGIMSPELHLSAKQAETQDSVGRLQNQR